MAEKSITHFQTLHEKLVAALKAHTNELLALFTKFEAKGNGFLQNNHIVAEFEYIPEAAQKKLVNYGFAEILNYSQEAVILSPFVALVVRPRLGVWEYIKVDVNALVVEELSVPDFLCL